MILRCLPPFLQRHLAGLDNQLSLRRSISTQRIVHPHGVLRHNDAGILGDCGVMSPFTVSRRSPQRTRIKRCSRWGNSTLSPGVAKRNSSNRYGMCEASAAMPMIASRVCGLRFVASDAGVFALCRIDVVAGIWLTGGMARVHGLPQSISATTIAAISSTTPSSFQRRRPALMAWFAGGAALIAESAILLAGQTRATTHCHVISYSPAMY